MASPGSFIPRTSRISDYLNTLHFHLLDISFQIPTVFNLAFGFRHCTPPEITIDVREVKEGTFEYRKPVVQGATAGPITLQQGAQLFNSDFYDWVQSALKATQSYRRNFLLLQFTDVSPFGVGSNGTGPLGGTVGSLINAVVPLNDLIARIPGRAWILSDCVPTHYRAASDFDPLSGDISIMELTLQPTTIDEISLGI